MSANELTIYEPHDRASQRRHARGAPMETSLSEDALKTTISHVATVERLKSIYVTGDRDRELKRKFDFEYRRLQMRQEALIAGTGKQELLEGTALCVVGATQAGKTAAMQELFRSYPEFQGYDQFENDSRLLSLRAPPACTSKRLALELLQASGYPVSARLEEHRLWELLYKRLKLRRIRVVHIDELQHASHVANAIEMKRLGASLKALLLNPEWPVMLVVVGIPQLLDFLKAYEELDRRTIYCRFRDIELSAASNATAISSYICQRAGASLHVRNTAEFGERLIVASRRQFGALIEWTIHALQVALSRQDEQHAIGEVVVDERAFAIAYADRTDCEGQDNYFLINNWRNWIADDEARKGASDISASPRRKKGKRK